MRDYLYLYAKQSNCLVFSGLEFADIHKALGLQYLVLLKHDFVDAQTDRGRSQLDYCESNELSGLSTQEIYDFGDLVFCDMPDTSSLEKTTDLGIAELLYFQQMAAPLNGVSIPDIGNSILAYCHDNGWFAKIYFTSSESVLLVLDFIKQHFQVSFCRDVIDDKALWITQGKVQLMEQNPDIDATLNKML